MTSQITAAGVQPGHARQVAAGLGVAGAHQHAAVLRLQREDVAGLHQVGRRGVARHRGLHGARAVGGRDAGGDAAGGLDRHRERRAVLVPLRLAIGGSCRRSQRSRVSVRQIRPRAWRAMKLMASGVTWSAASTRSPSFSRSSSSTRITMRPAASSATSSGTGEMGMGRDCRLARTPVMNRSRPAWRCRRRRRSSPTGLHVDEAPARARRPGSASGAEGRPSRGPGRAASAPGRPAIRPPGRRAAARR